MKIKKKAAIAAAAFLTMTNFSACNNYNQDVYGPPVREWEQEETDTETVSNADTTQNEETTSFDPDENQNAGVYGPPEEEYNDTTQTEEETSPDNSEETEGDEQQ